MEAVNSLAKGDILKKRFDQVEFDHMIYVEQQVILIQAGIRRYLCLKKLEKQVEMEKRRLNLRQSQKAISPEQRALTEFKQQLARKKLTPEAFFRICDDQYEQKVSEQKFKQMISNFNIKLTSG